MDNFYSELLKQNAVWAKEQTEQHPEFFQELAQGQAPEALFIGCSDSRVGIEIITQCDPGAVFVHRNISNSVLLTDMNLMSVLQFSVEILKVKYIIVCGHYECGGCKAALSDESFGIIDLWLSHIKDSYQVHREELDSIADPNAREKRLIELHVVEQLLNLEKSNIIQKAVAQNDFPVLKGWVFDLHTGKIIDITDQYTNAKHDKIYSYRQPPSGALGASQNVK